MKVESPEYTAVITWLPALRLVDAENEAVPFANRAEPNTAEPSLRVMLPVEVAVTERITLAAVTVKVMFWPITDGLSEDLTVIFAPPKLSSVVTPEKPSLPMTASSVPSPFRSAMAML